MKLRLLFVLLASVGIAFADPGDPMPWWPNHNTQQAPALNYAPANLGQLKNMAKAAKAHLDATLVDGAGFAVNSMVASFGPDNGVAYTQAEKEENYKPVNIGQVKAVAKPFYSRLKAAGFDTKGDISARLSAVWPTPVTWTSDFPWNPSTPKQDNYAPANIGQLKFVFGFDLTSFDTDQDGMGNAWEMAQFGNLAQDGTADTDNDGVADLNEFLHAGNPHTSDTDGDGDSDLQEVIAGTNPADAEDFTPRKIAYFPMDSVSSGTPTFLDGNLEAPKENVGVEQVAGRKGKAARLNEIGDRLSYPRLRADGVPNIALKRGTVRFWFRPEWPSSGSPGNPARFIQLGQYSSDRSLALWGLTFQPENHKMLYTLNSGTNTGSFSEALYGLGDHSGLAGNGWLANTWHQFTFTYSPTGRKLYIDGVLMATVASSPIADFRLSDFDTTGIMIGSDGGQPLKGAVDEVEFFNYELSAAQIEADYAEEVMLGLDANGNGLPDAWDLLYFVGITAKIGAKDDYDGDGLMNYQEWKLGTNPTLTDSDYDGRSDGMEVADKTNPLNASSAKQLRLGYFPMSTAEFLGSIGEVPLQKASGAGVTVGRIGKGFNIPYQGYNQYVRYRDVEAGGKANINFLRGSIRLWFKPLWDSNGSGAPGTSSPLIACGVRTTNATEYYWALTVEPGGGAMKFIMQDANGNTIERLVEANLDLDHDEWYEIVLVYGPSSSKLYINGSLSETGGGSTLVPDVGVRALGFSVGSDRAGSHRVLGVVDEVETFNYELTQTQIESNYAKQLALGVDSDSDGLSDAWEMLKFGNLNQNGYGDPDNDGWTNLDEWRKGTNPSVADRTPGTPSNKPANFGVSKNSLGGDDVTWTPTPSGEVVIQTSTDGVTWTTVAIVSGGTGTVSVPTANSNAPAFYRIGSPGDWSEWASSNPFEDYDGDGLSNEEEASSGTNPTNEDSDGDGALDNVDGWALWPALSPLRLPEVRYAVITLAPEGVAELITNRSHVLIGVAGGYQVWANGALSKVPDLDNIVAMSENDEFAGTADPGESISTYDEVKEMSFAYTNSFQRARMTFGGAVKVGNPVWLGLSSQKNDALYRGPNFGTQYWATGSSAEYITPNGTIYCTFSANNSWDASYSESHETGTTKYHEAMGFGVVQPGSLSPTLTFRVDGSQETTKDEEGEETVGPVIASGTNGLGDVEFANDFGCGVGTKYIWGPPTSPGGLWSTTTVDSQYFDGESISSLPAGFEPSAISNAAEAWIVGQSAGEFSVFAKLGGSWMLRKPLKEGMIFGNPTDVNTRGEVLGGFVDMNGRSGQLLRNQKPVDLNGATNDTWSFFGVRAINDKGFIIAQGTKARDDNGNLIPIALRKQYPVGIVPIELSWEAQEGYENVEDNKRVTQVDASGNPATREWMQGKGKKIFPDRKNPTDTTPNRNRCVLHINSALSNYVIYLKAFDVDDATPNLTDSDPANKLDSNGTNAGDDNKDTLLPKTGRFVSSGSSVATVTLDANGEADVIFETTKQPGDNFRVAAAFKQEDLNLLQVSNPDGNGFIDGDSDMQAKEFNGAVSPMLTVWRRLWCEFDSMNEPAQDEDGPGESNFQDVEVGSENAYVENYPIAGQSTLGIYPALPYGDDSYEDGKLYIGGIPYKIISNNTIDATVTIEGKPGSSVLGTTVRAYDDDISIKGIKQPRNLPYQLKLSGIFYKSYSDAYIEPLMVPSEYIDKDVPFNRNLNTADYWFEWEPVVTTGKDLENTEDFWVAYLLAGWQPYSSIDDDPDDETGEEFGQSDALSDDWNQGVIYIETLRESEASPYYPHLLEDLVVAHEIGHQGKGAHTDGGIMSKGAATTDFFFNPITIKRFRENRKF